MTDNIKVGTRKSRLALIQTEWVVENLKAKHPRLNVRIVTIGTTGDKFSSAPFAQIGSVGLFVHELEKALQSGVIDLAVHSLKDLPGTLSPDLMLGAVTERASAHDALVSREDLKLNELKAGSIIGTSSTRRRALLKSERPDLNISECRGNLTTRLEKLDRGDFDAIILAEAGLERMGLSQRISERFDVGRFVPAVGQGALGVEIRLDDIKTAELVEPLNHEPTRKACNEERSFLSEIGGGCHVPVGGHAYYDGTDAVFISFASTNDCMWQARSTIRVPSANIEGLGILAAESIRSKDGSEAFFREAVGYGC